MESANFATGDPTLLLLNEIEILLAQTRLMELYLKQAQAISANESARAHAQHQAELTSLRAALAQHERALSAQRSGTSDTEQKLLNRVQVLENHLADKDSLLKHRDGQLENVNAEAAQLRHRVSQLQSANDQFQADAQVSARSREELQSALGALRQELQAQQSDFQQRQRRAQESQENLHRQLEQMHGELSARDSSANAAAELDRARTEMTLLHGKIVELEESRREIEAAAALGLEQSRARFETELTGLRSALSERDFSLQESHRAIGEIERGFKEQIETLHNQLGAIHKLIETRDHELGSAYNQIGDLQRRIADLEADHQRTAASAQESAGIRSSLENEIAQLQYEVTVKERELTQRYEAVTAVELALHAKIQVLEQERARSRNELEERESEIRAARQEISELSERIGQLQSACAEAESSGKRFVEETRQRVENELNRLHASLAQKEHALRERENAFQALEEQLNATFNQLRAELDQQQQTTARANEELAQFRAATAALEEQKNQAELSQREIEQNRQHALAQCRELENQLQTKNSLLSAESNDREVVVQLDAKNQELQQQLAEKQSLIEYRDRDLERLHGELGGLAERLSGREAAIEELNVQFQKELEARRNAHQAELTHQREQAIINQQTLEKVLLQEQERATGLARRVDDLESRERSLEATSAETATLRGRLQELEAQRDDERSKAKNELYQVRADRQAELESLRGDIQQKSLELAEQQASVEELKRSYQSQIQSLEARLDGLQNGDGGRNAEIEKARAQAITLQSRVEQLESELRNAQLSAAHRFDQSQLDYAARLAELNALIAEKNAAIEQHNAAAAQIEQALRDELASASRDAHEKSLILQNRNDELVRVKAEMDSLQDKHRILEAAASQNEAAISQDTERMQIEFQAQLAALQAELSQKEWSLEEQRATTISMDRQYREEIETLRRQLEEQAAHAKPATEDFIFDDTTFSPEQRERYIKFKQMMNAESAATDPTQSPTDGQRWRSRFGWTRRWKS